jgi:hypothetical protein
MVHGLSIFHLIVLVVQLMSIASPFLQIAHARHARVLISAIVGVTLVLFLVVLLFISHIADRSDLVLMRCYAFSSAFCCLIDELLSARDGKSPIRVIPLTLFALLFLLLLIAMIGGISGAF